VRVGAVLVGGTNVGDATVQACTAVRTGSKNVLEGPIHLQDGERVSLEPAVDDGCGEAF